MVVRMDKDALAAAGSRAGRRFPEPTGKRIQAPKWFGMVAVLLAAGFGSGCCMMLGGFGGLHTVKLPLSVQVVDATTGKPIEGAHVGMDWRYGPGGWDWGKRAETETRSDGWATIEEVPNLRNNGVVAGHRSRQLVYLNRIYVWADGYNGNSVAGTRPYSLGLKGLKIPLRREGDIDGRTQPIDVWVVDDDDDAPIPDAEVWLGWKWVHQGVSWHEALWAKTDEAGHVRFQWTPPPCFDSAESAWKSRRSKFSMYAGTHGNGQRKGIAQELHVSGNSLVLRLQ